MKKIIIGVILLALVGLGALYVFYMRVPKADFDNNIDTVFASCMEMADNKTEYMKMESIDAYYYKDKKNLNNDEYFYHTVYSTYWEEDGEWHPYTEVHYGAEGDVSYIFNKAEWSTACPDKREEYEIAVEKGQHKSYTKEEIQELIDSFQYNDEE